MKTTRRSELWIIWLTATLPLAVLIILASAMMHYYKPETSKPHHIKTSKLKQNYIKQQQRAIESSITKIKNSILKQQDLHKTIKTLPNNMESFYFIANKDGVVTTINVANKQLLQKVKSELPTILPQAAIWKEHADLFMIKFYIDKWSVVAGFDASSFTSLKEPTHIQYQDTQNSPLPLLILAFAALVSIVGLLFALWIRKIFARYHEQISIRESALKQLNKNIEQEVDRRVADECDKHWLQIEHSKMNAIAEVVSLVANKWQKPLSSVSQILLDLQKKSKIDNLRPDELCSALDSCDETLMQMSQTLYDFRNFYRPSQTKELVLMCDVLTYALNLVGTTLELNGIDITSECEHKQKVNIYRNELIQIVAALLLQTKQILDRSYPAVVELSCYETGQFIIVRITAHMQTSTDIDDKNSKLHMVNSITQERFNGSVEFNKHGGKESFYIKIDKVEAT